MAIIIGFKIMNREAQTLEVQKILTREGCYIKTRLGLHDVDENSCSPTGLVLLQIFGSEEIGNRITNELNALEGVEAKIMILG